MSIFGKHIFRSIKKEPLQPVMIVLIVTLCVAVMILSVALPLNIYKNERARLGIDEWTADIEITLKSTSGVRLIFEDDVASAVGEKARVIGEFSLTGFSAFGESEKTLVNIGALDLVRADGFFEIRYTDYGKITNNNIDKVAIIGEGFAKEHGLSLGDTVEVNVLGESFGYVIEAIAKETGILKNEDMIVDISSVRKALAERSPLIASLSSDFDPYTKIHVNVNDGFFAEELKAELEELDSFADKRVALASDVSDGDYMTTILTATIAIPAVLLLIIAVMMMVSTLELLQKKRQSDIALFKIVGADSSHLCRILYLEGVIYGAVGGAFGSLLSIPAIAYLNSLYGFKHSVMSFGLGEVFVGLCSSMTFTLLSTYVYLRRQRGKSAEKEILGGKFDTDRRFSYKNLVLVVPILISLAVMLTVPARYRYLPASILLFSTVAFIYVIAPYIVGAFATLLTYLASKGRSRAGRVILASRSCFNSYALRHAGRIMTILVTVFISMTFVLSVVEKQLVTYTEFAAFDYAGVQVDDGTKKEIEGLDGVISTAETMIDRNVVIDGGIITIGISVDGDRDGCFSENILPENMPKGNSIALSRGVARMLGLKIGDPIKCSISDVPCELILTEIVDTHGDFAYYDASYVGVGLDMLCILTDGTEKTRESLIAIFDERGIEYLDKDAFIADTYSRVKSQLVAFKAMFYVMVFMTAVGIFNVLAEQRMERKREFDIIRLNGAERKDVFALQAIEVSILFITALLSSAIFSHLICTIVDTVATSFGMTLYV